MQEDSFSVCISNFLKSINGIEQRSQAILSEIQRYDLLEQDLLHKLELKNLDAVQMVKVAKKLKQCREERRYYKDELELIIPVRDFLANQSNKKAIHNIQEMLGSVRAKERSLNTRKYTPRIMTKEEYEE